MVVLKVSWCGIISAPAVENEGIPSINARSHG